DCLSPRQKFPERRLDASSLQHASKKRIGLPLTFPVLPNAPPNSSFHVPCSGRQVQKFVCPILTCGQGPGRFFKLISKEGRQTRLVDALGAAVIWQPWSK